MAGNKPINKPVRGVRDSIPGGYVLGRTGNGKGPPILLPVNQFTTKGYVANTTIQVGGPAGGDLSGTYPNPGVAKIQGNAVKPGTPTDKQVLQWVNANSDWEPATVGLLPTGGTTNQVLTKNSSSDFDTSWQTPSAGSSGSPSSIYLDGTDGYMALVDATTGQIILDGNGNATYIKDPTLPSVMLPLASSTQFGAVEVDNISIAAVAGIIGTKLYGFFSGRGANQSVSDGVWTPIKPDVIAIDTTGNLNGTTGIFTASKAGKYFFFANVQAGAATSIQNANVRLSKNGTIGAGGTSQASGNTQGSSGGISQTTSCMAIVSMAINDTMEADCLVSATGGSDILEGGGVGLIAVTYFGGLFLGT